MSQLHAGDVSGAVLAPAVCPNCHGSLTARSICWKCCDRLCAGCGQPTGSAFIVFCWPCSYRESAAERLGETTPPVGAGLR
jgi:hypothetical protein